MRYFLHLSQLDKLTTSNRLSLALGFLSACWLGQPLRCCCWSDHHVFVITQQHLWDMELVRDSEGLLTPRMPHQFPFSVGAVAGSGRCLVSTREIRPGETILTDSAILVGPASPTVCIVCCSSRQAPGYSCSLGQCGSTHGVLLDLFCSLSPISRAWAGLLVRGVGPVDTRSAPPVTMTRTSVTLSRGAATQPICTTSFSPSGLVCSRPGTLRCLSGYCRTWIITKRGTKTRRWGGQRSG